MLMNAQLLLTILIFAPLCGALINAFLLRKFHISVVASVATLSVIVPFFCALQLFLLQSSQPIGLDLFPLISIDSSFGSALVVPFAFVVDHLSALFLLIITGVGSLIHLYSAEYMKSETNPYRFFVYLNLFIFSMLLLVLGSNMVVTFIGWEGVGVCSYLLIGYWYEDTANSMAAIKAFLFNRVGDAGFLIAMFLSYSVFHSVAYADIAQFIAHAPADVLAGHSVEMMLIGFCLLLGVCGKSAQIPLYTWLPDAMAGPTPVSALIHAATMVTAGIYLMNRTSFILVQSPVVMTTIACVGAATALFSATIGLAQTDIKKVLAYSTCSQLGYMVLACGVGAFQYGVSHVITHAFFKACLFLGAGSVIHALHHEQDIRNMGGLFKKMPITALTFILATLAIIGFPGFSGFFSKDAILAAAWSGPYGHPALWLVGFLTAGLTAFYMLRLTWLVFFSPCRAAHPEHIHENNLIITLPLILLGGLSVVGGLICVPELFTGHKDFISDYLSPVLAQAQQAMESGHHTALELSHQTEWLLMAITSAFVLVSAVTAVVIYRNGPAGGQKWANLFGGLYRLVLDKWRVDEFYHALIVRPLGRFAVFLYAFIDRILIEGAVNGTPEVLYLGTGLASDSQSGITRSYLKLMFLGILLFGTLLFISF